jgi:hypothetical protein
MLFSAKVNANILTWATDVGIINAENYKHYKQFYPFLMLKLIGFIDIKKLDEMDSNSCMYQVDCENLLGRNTNKCGKIFKNVFDLKGL